MAQILEVEEKEGQRSEWHGISCQSNSRFIGVWIVALMLFLVTSWTAVYEREFLFEVWPQSEKLFMTLGIEIGDFREEAAAPLPNPSEFIDFSDKAETEIFNASIKLNISGKLTNNGTVAVEIPDLRGVLRNAAEEEIHSWNFTIEPATLAPGEERRFSTIVEDIPPETAEYQLYIDWPEPAPLITDSGN